MEGLDVLGEGVVGVITAEVGEQTVEVGEVDPAIQQVHY
jgi:hypothetical protein